MCIIPARTAEERALSRRVRLEPDGEETESRDWPEGSKARPESDWIRSEASAWRIVTDEQWEGVQERLRFVREKFHYTILGGINRTAQSRTYLFSGLLVCSECGSRMVIVSGGGTRGYVKYGCPAHRYKGVCKNRLTIRRDRLETQLLNALETRFLRADMAAYLMTSFEKQLRARIKEMGHEDYASLFRAAYRCCQLADNTAEPIDRKGVVRFTLWDHLGRFGLF